MQRLLLVGSLLLTAANVAAADWRTIGPGVSYQEFREGSLRAYVTRVDLREDKLSVVVSRRSQKGMRVSEFARDIDAIAAVNGDYFTDRMVPVGLTVGTCGQWEGTRDTRREGFLAVGDEKAQIYAQSEVVDPPEKWMRSVISGWPLLVEDCEAKTSSQLPGSRTFTRSPHPRTAVALSKNGTTLYLIVADGRREGVPGLTLAELAEFIEEELHACSALNLDGGGSSAMTVDDRIVNHPSDGSERRVANHIGVVLREDVPQCSAGSKP